MGLVWFASMFLIVSSIANAEGQHGVRLHRHEDAIGYLSQESFPSNSGTQSVYICDSCLYVSQEAEKILTDPQLVEQVGTALSKVCHVLPPDYEPKCLGMLNTYMHQAMVVLQNFFKKENLCYSSGLCSQNEGSFISMSLIRRKPSSLLHNVALNGEAVELSDEKICTSCHNAVEETLKWLQDPEAKLKLIKALLKACDDLDINSQKCKKMVFQCGPLLLANLEKYITNNDICNMVHFCDGAGTGVAVY